jgi:hypothetical protein
MSANALFKGRQRHGARRIEAFLDESDLKAFEESQ